MLKADGITIYNEQEERTLISDLSFIVKSGDKVALIGEEGNGKSTLLRFLAGFDMGYLKVTGAVVAEGPVAYMEQDPKRRYGEEDTVSFFLKKNPEDEIDPEDFALLGQVDKLLSRVDFPKEAFSFDKTFGSYSGGEAIKLSLVKMLLRDPDIYLFDEPSNDLDSESVAFLASFMKDTPKGLIFVSHDESLLSEVSTGVIHLERTQRKKEALSTFSPLSYERYKEERSSSRERQTALALKERERLEQKEKRYRRVYQNVENQLLATKSNQPEVGRLLKKHMHSLKSQGKRLDREREDLTEIPDLDETINVFFRAQKDYNPQKIITIAIRELKTGERLLSHNLTLTIKGAERIAILGRNGVGKTTFLRCSKNFLENQEGLKVAYFPQDYSEALDYMKTPLENLSENVDKETVTRFRLLLGSLLFTSEEMLYPVGKLSEGEKGKILLARLVAEGANVLLLDEPTRNFSPLSQSQLITFFSAFKGPILFVSHDERFVNALASRRLLLTIEGFVEAER